MAASRPSRTSELDAGPAALTNTTSPLPSLGFDSNPPTHAAFSPTTSLTGTVGSHRRSTILLHQKSPLLLATPPQITRALAYSHPFLTPINTFLGLVSWTSGDPWESFLLVAAWWAIVLYGDWFVRIAGPLVVVVGLILGMYGRRFSLLSSSGWSEFTAGTRLNKASSNSTTGGLTAGTAAGMAGAGASGSGGKPGNTASSAAGKEDGKKHKRNVSKDSTYEGSGTRHQKTLDEIVATLRELTTRCNILLEPLLEMTDFLSTQRTATTASTRPALTTLFVRLLLCTPVWWILTLPPLRIVTTRRVMLVFGTVVLTWHARVMRVARAILWRSRTVRKIARLVTGLQFEDPPTFNTATSAGSDGKGSDGKPIRRESELTKALRRQQRARGGEPAGVRFTFIIYENQRRWVGLGWTTSLFSYERAAWTDEHNNPVPPKDDFELPEVEEGARARWRWVDGSRWRVDGVKEDLSDYDSEAGKAGWVYYDNKWQNGRRGQDGWGRWTRRRKWYRDAELVELSEAELAELNRREEERMAVEAVLAVAEQEEAHKEKDAGKANGRPKPPPLPDRNHSALPPQISTVNAISESSLGGQAIFAELADTSNRGSSAPQIPAHSEASSIRERDSDGASIMSTSSRSRVFGTLRKRGDPGWSGRHRRASEAASEDADASLGPARALQIQGAGRNDGWGLGDEARMNME